jgi:hypothetical protein
MNPTHTPPLYPSFRPPIHPFLHPSFRPPIPPQPTFNPSVCPVTTVERMDVEPNPKNPTLKIPPSKAWRRLHRANATSPLAAHCIANNPRTVQRSAAQRNQLAAHRPAYRIPCIAAHCIASCAAQRTARMQPARAQRIASQTIRAPCSAPPAQTTSPPRIARRARRTPRTCSSAHALRSTLRSFIWFVGLTFPKFNLYTSRIEFSLCFLSSVGSQL